MELEENSSHLNGNPGAFKKSICVPAGEYPSESHNEIPMGNRIVFVNGEPGSSKKSQRP
jgi:hypothetical protein